jgi:CopG family transcriptional regulator/antitoxin EndoAI
MLPYNLYIYCGKIRKLIVCNCEVCILAENKKILISIPENLLRELDNAVKEEGTNRSDFIRKSIRFYLIEKRKLEIRNKMKAGYLEMSKINKSITEEYSEGDYEDFLSYETKLLGSE